MEKAARITLLVVAITLAACVPASPTATLPSQAVVPTPTPTGEPSSTPTPIPPSPTATYTPSPSPTPTETATPTPATPTPLPQISASCHPDASAPLGDLVILRGPEHLFDPSCQVSGGVGQITASWDIDRDGTPVSAQIDPAPMSIAPGEHRPLVTFADEAGQTLQVELPRIVKVGEPRYPGWRYGVMAHINLNFGSYANDAQVEKAVQMIRDTGVQAVRVDFTWAYIEPSRKGNYNWSDYDRMVKIMRNHGLEILPLVGYSTQWASSGSGPHWQD